MSEPNTRPNPYVGPRPFTAHDPLPGRRREVRELRSLLVAERIVLLHSPSGAGKTSLLAGQGGLQQALGEQYHIRPTIRINQPLPAELAGREPRPNRYVLSVLRSLEQAPGPAGPIPLLELATLSVTAYLERRSAELTAPRGAGARSRRELLIFDQFEEVLTADPRDDAGRVELFEELAQVLAERRRWALFVIREDFLGALQPWVQGLPTQLARRFRIDLLGEAGAREAICAPAAAQGVRFEPDALDHLVQELRQVRVQALDGELELRTGLWVEPVQLQVVCRRLWSRLGLNDMNIERTEVQHLGDVDAALAAFYSDQVATIAGESGGLVSERTVREWVGTRLISPQGARTQVMKGERESDGLPNRIVAALQDAHLIRAEERHGVKWYELAHDRLVGPVRTDNEAWLREHLHPIQLQAGLWMQQREPNALLLSEDALQSAAAWAKQHPEALSPGEHKFLTKSTEAREAERAVRQAQIHALAAEKRRAEDQTLAVVRQRRLTRIIAAVGVVALAAAGLSYDQTRKALAARATAEEQKERADEQAGAAREATRVAVAGRAVSEGRVAHGQAILRETEDESPMQRVPGWLEGALAALERPGAEVVAFRQHGDRVTSAAFGPDGATVVTASFDKTARLWDAATGQQIVALSGHQDWVASAAFSPDGTRVVTASGDRTARIWDIATGKFVALSGHQDTVRSAAFSPDGSQVLTLCDDQTARLWDARTGTQLFSLVGDPGGVRAAAFSADGARIIASQGATANSWHAGTGERLVRFSGHREDINGAAFSTDGQRVVTASDDGTARVWDATTGAVVAVFTAHQGRVRSAAFSPDGQRVVTGSDDQTARVWSATTGEAIATLSGRLGVVRSAAFSPDGSRVVTVSEDNTTWLWDATSGDIVATLAGHREWIRSAAFSPDGATIVTGSGDRTARVWSTRSGLELAALAGERAASSVAMYSADSTRIVTVAADAATVWDPSTGRALTTLVREVGGILSAMPSPDGARIVTTFVEPEAQVWDANTGKLQRTLSAHQGSINAAAFSPDGARVVTASQDSTARIWDLNKEQPPMTLAGHRGPVLAATFSPSGDRVVTASEDRTARVWDASTGTSIASLDGHEHEVRVAVFSPDGARVATGALDGTVRVWDATTGKQAFSLAAQEISDSRVFSPDGARVVTQSMDATARVWDAATGTELLVLSGHQGRLHSAAFSPDGTRIVTASDDETARIWNATTGSVLATLVGHQSRVLRADFSADGRHILTRAERGPVRIWWAANPDDGDSALRLLWRATALCPTVDDRVSALGVDRARAQVEAGACETMVQCIHLPPVTDATFAACLAQFRRSRATR